MAESTKLGKYEIRSELGRGAMGVVYEAYDPLIERIVALKTIRPEALLGAHAAEILARFRREAQAAGKLTHPNIVGIYDFGEDGGVWYIAMELVKGRELKDYFEKNERFATADIVRILSQILSALGYSHKLGVVHRDIKPSNVFLLADGTVKVADFGIAHVESSELTQVGTVLGTPAYMSPEQILGLPVDGRSDLFSVGVILYQFLTGERPFTGNATITMRKVLEEDPLPPSRFNVQIPGAMDAVVRRALAKKADERFQTAEEFVQALVDAAAAKPVSSGETTMAPAPATASAKPAKPPAPGRKSQAPAIAVVLGIVVIAAMVGTWWALQGRGARDDAPVSREGNAEGRTAGSSARSHARCAAGCREADARRVSVTDRAGRGGDFGGRPRRSDRRALPGGQGTAAGRSARGFAQPARREGGVDAGRAQVGREELRRGPRQAPVAQRRFRHHGRARKRAGDRQGRPRVAHDGSRGEREGRAEVAERDVAQRAHRVHSRKRRPARRGAHRDARRRPAGRARRSRRWRPRTSSRIASSRSVFARGPRTWRATARARRISWSKAKRRSSGCR